MAASSKTPTELDGLELAQQCVASAQDKKALDPVILDLRKISTITDYLVICSAQSGAAAEGDRQRRGEDAEGRVGASAAGGGWISD